MIRLCTALLLVFGTVSAANAQDWANKLFATQKHDFGTVARGAKAVYNFEITNLYEEEIHIASVRSSCGCTSPSIVNDTLKTWEKGAIEAVFNTNSFTGQRQATITVTIDKPYRAEVQLNITGFIRTDVVVDPGGVQFGTTDMGQAVERNITITYAGREDWKITDVRSANDNLEVELNQTGRLRGQVSYSMKVRLKDTAPPGYINDQLTVITDDSRLKQVTIPVEGQVLSPLSVSPASLFLGILGPGEQATKRLVVRAKKPFRIIGVQCDECLKLDVNQDEAKDLHLIPVTFTAGDSAGKIAEKIIIQTDLGQGVTAECLATATVQAPVASEAPVANAGE